MYDYMEDLVVGKFYAAIIVIFWKIESLH